MYRNIGRYLIKMLINTVMYSVCTYSSKLYYTCYYILYYKCCRYTF